MDVFIGATSAICPLGNDPQDIFLAMAQGKTGIKGVENAFDLGKEEFLGIVPDEHLTHKENTKLRSMISSSLNQSLEKLKDPKRIKSPQSRVILCTTKGEIEKLENQDLEGAQLYQLSTFLKDKYELAHTPSIVSSACISGLLGIINAARLIKAGAADQVFVVGVDRVTPFTLSGFISFYATATTPSKPYDKSRDGINLGEAAASVVLSKDSTIYKEVLAKYLGGGSANDANHISGPSRTGEGLYRSVKNALDEAEIDSTELHFVSAHGTATAFNDEMEAIALDRLGMNDIPVNSMKGYFGHTLGAAGLLESIVGLQSLRNGKLLKSLGYENSGVSKKISVLKENKEGSFSTMLKTSSGFGGSNAAAIFEII